MSILHIHLIPKSYSTLKKKITTSSTISYADSNLVSGKTYYYKVRPYRSVNGKVVHGSYSSVKSKK